MKRDVKYIHPVAIRLDAETIELTRQICGIEGGTVSQFIRASILMNIQRVRSFHKYEREAAGTAS